MNMADCGFPDMAGFPAREWLARFGPTLEVRVGFDSHLWQAVAGTPGGPIDREVPSVPLPALVDTGAADSCIDDALAVNLQLPVVDEVTVGGVGGAHQAQVYLAQIYIPDLGIGHNGSVLGAHLSDGGQMHRVLIGRSFLQHLNLIYDGPAGAVKIFDRQSLPRWKRWLLDRLQ